MGCERTLHSHPSPGPPLACSREAEAWTRLCVKLLGLDRSAPVEAQDRAKVGAVPISQHFEPNSQVGQLLKQLETARREI